MIVTAIVVLLLALALVIALLLGQEQIAEVLVGCIRRVMQAGAAA